MTEQQLTDVINTLDRIISAIDRNTAAHECQSTIIAAAFMLTHKNWPFDRAVTAVEELRTKFNLNSPEHDNA